MDIFEKCRRFTRAKEAIEAGIYPYFRPLSGNDGPRVFMEGREIIMIGSNNYLGLTHDPRVIEAAIAATKQYGTSCSGSRFLNGTLDLHHQLENKIAQFMNREAALIFSTGYMANLGGIATLVGKDEYIILDKSDHASIYAGTRAAIGAQIKRFVHNDMESLERVLSQLEPETPKLIVCDGVFSMEGDIVRLAEILPLAQKYNAQIYIDEAHGVGVLGEHGRGACEYLGLEEHVEIVMSTFSKSLASIGGFVAGPQYVIDYIKHHASPLIFSASPTPAATAAVLKSIEIIETEPEHMQRLHHISDKMRYEFKRLGFDIGHSKDTPIIPLYIRNDDLTFLFWKRLFEEGVYSNAVISPAVAPDQALIRTSFMSTHTDEDLDKVLEIAAKVGKELGIIQ
ncbi:aminotransferase class I/II-fold pyridoxal phosphate-dependent enzyme [Caldithrix abyssi]|uniref:8-amino-7-oxononanoate synthase n=1 Tax=Caldithrix abyssi DSM 13497 TaxID=880073 RepID=H1XQ81_CALAY|nr:aminotransferase class I/II-fold pyridoxal phosphate-dependent enzyme [Caldithrix abyssi]APF19499.1 8-amino-7-oxononanoate synthase [Caldithrix abyssi DSM 13497]EHO43386.1 aminotransferase class I and II [Caldithrix abyssi DSM 13497]